MVAGLVKSKSRLLLRLASVGREDFFIIRAGVAVCVDEP